MLTIRQEQTEAFRQHHLRKFEDEMVGHGKEFSPRLCEILGDEQVRVAIRAAMGKAIWYGFTNRGPLRLYVEMMFLCGSAFDTDPQYAVVGEVLRASEDQMVRAERIHQGTLRYRDEVAGSETINVRNALRNLAMLAQAPITLSSDNLTNDLIQEMGRIFPQKVAYVGDARMKTLIYEGFAEARRYGFSTVRQLTLITALMFAFGHGCNNDPLYPWISRTLHDQKIVNPSDRAKRLEKKALTWLSHVLARPAAEPKA